MFWIILLTIYIVGLIITFIVAAVVFNLAFDEWTRFKTYAVILLFSVLWPFGLILGIINAIIYRD